MNKRPEPSGDPAQASKQPGRTASSKAWALAWPFSSAWKATWRWKQGLEISTRSHAMPPSTNPSTHLPQRLGVLLLLAQALHGRLRQVRQHAPGDERGHLLRQQVLRQPLWLWVGVWAGGAGGPGQWVEGGKVGCLPVNQPTYLEAPHVLGLHQRPDQLLVLGRLLLRAVRRARQRLDLHGGNGMGGTGG